MVRIESQLDMLQKVPVGLDFLIHSRKTKAIVQICVDKQEIITFVLIQNVVIYLVQADD